MRGEKSNFVVYLPSQRSGVSRTTNISDLLARSKEELKREKIIKMYTLLGFFGLIFLFCVIFYLLK